MGDGVPLSAALREIFYPRSVAVIGASNRPGNFGALFLKALQEAGFPVIYPVNPNESQVLGLPAYPEVAAIPGAVDLAVIATPTATVPSVVAQCAAKGAKGAIIYSSGFGEQGAEGKRQEQELVRLARARGLRLIGPNCMGIYCPASCLTFTSGLPKESGPVALISHSGSLSNMITSGAAALGLRFSIVVSCGNQADLGAADFLDYFGHDPETKLILFYLEGVKEGRRFLAVAREVSRRKPVIIWKGGLTPAGARAAASHTGALASAEVVWPAFFAQSGAIPVRSYEELLDAALAFNHLPPAGGRRVVIVSGPGGPAVATTDACIEAGLEMATLSPESKEKLRRFLPPVGTVVSNPLDLGMGIVFNPQWYVEAISILMEDPGVDLVLAIGSGRAGYGPILAGAARPGRKPVVVCLPSPAGWDADAKFFLEKGIPVYSDGRRAAVALARLAAYWRRRAEA